MIERKINYFLQCILPVSFFITLFALLLPYAASNIYIGILIFLLMSGSIYVIYFTFAHRVIVKVVDETIYVNGIFKKGVFQFREIKSISLQKNYWDKVFDTRKIVIIDMNNGRSKYRILVWRNLINY